MGLEVSGVGIGGVELERLDWSWIRIGDSIGDSIGSIAQDRQESIGSGSDDGWRVFRGAPNGAERSDEWIPISSHTELKSTIGCVQMLRSASNR